MLHVAHEGTEITYGHEDLLKYTGRKNVIAAALCYRMLKWMFSVLSPRTPPERSKLNFRIAFDGPGIIDCLEMVAKARSQDRIRFDPFCAPPEAPPAPDGQFHFEASYEEQFCSAYPEPWIFPPGFVDQVKLFQEGGGTATEQRAYLRMKEKFSARILSMPVETLFLTREWREQIINPAKLRRLTRMSGRFR